MQSVQGWAWGMTNIFISSKIGQIFLPYIIHLGIHFILLRQVEVLGKWLVINAPMTPYLDIGLPFPALKPFMDIASHHYVAFATDIERSQVLSQVTQ